MKLIIAGSRDLIASTNLIMESIMFFHISGHAYEIVSGGCSTGIDSCAKIFAKDHGYQYIEFPADWNQFGKSAGPRRNSQMAEYADALLLIWDGESKGSANMKMLMRALDKPVYEVILKTYV